MSTAWRIALAALFLFYLVHGDFPLRPDARYTHAFWGALIGAGIGLGTSLFGSKKPKPTPLTPEEKAAYESQTGLNKELTTNLTAGRGYAADLVPQAKSFYDTGQRYSGDAYNAYLPTLDYYRRLQTGNRATLQNMYAPEISQIRARYAASGNAARTLSPRSGYTAAAAAEAPMAANRDISALYQGAREAGAAGLQKTGAGLADLGYGAYGAGGNLYGAGGNFLNASTAAGSSALRGNESLLNFSLGKRRQDLADNQYSYDTGRGMGSSVFEMLKGIDWSKIFKKGK